MIKALCDKIRSEVTVFSSQTAIALPLQPHHDLKESVRTSFRILVEAVQLPTRYFGSKTWSIPGVISRTPVATFRRIFQSNNGISFKEMIFNSCKHYQYNLESISAKHTIKFFPYVFALISGHIAEFSSIKSFGYTLVNPQTLNISQDDQLKSIIIKSHCFFDSNSGLKATLFVKNDELIIAFGGLKSYDVEMLEENKPKTRQMMIQSAAFNCLGLKPKIYSEAETLLLAILKSQTLQNKKIVLTGQCFGGAIAQYLGIKYQLATICFNSIPLGAGLQQEIGPEKLLKAHQYVTHISVKNDYISDLKYISIPDRILSLIGITTPGNFGKRYVIPSAFKDNTKTHAYVSGSMMHYLGHCPKTGPMELSPDDPILAANV